MLAQRGDSIPSSKISLSALVSDVFKLLSLSLSLSLCLCLCLSLSLSLSLTHTHTHTPF